MLYYGMDLFFFFLFFQFCDAAQVTIIHNYIYPNLVMLKIWKVGNLKHPFMLSSIVAICDDFFYNMF